MKKILSLSFALLALTVTSCKKEKNDPACEVSVAGIAANYKVTKVELVSASGNTDVSGSFLTDCSRSGLYQLRSDRTTNYVEIASSCTGSGPGTWNVTGNNFSLTNTGDGFNFTNAPITLWNCSAFQVNQSQTVGSVILEYKYTFTKQ